METCNAIIKIGTKLYALDDPTSENIYDFIVEDVFNQIINITPKVDEIATEAAEWWDQRYYEDYFTNSPKYSITREYIEDEDEDEEDDDYVYPVIKIGERL